MVAYKRLKTIRKSLNFQVQKVVAVFDRERFGLLDRWSLMGGGCYERWSQIEVRL